jgi:hypothetical protein
MEQVCEPANLNRAYARVMANKGAPGIDGMPVGKLGGWIKRHKQSLIASLLDGSYQPQPVRGVQIPKPGGKGMRQLGIPTVVDRLVQQAMLQVLEAILDPTFSASSYGFRPGRGAHDALAQARQYLQRMDEWTRRKLRCLRLKQRKRTGPIAEFLHQLGVPKRRAWIGALSGKGWWRRSGSPPAMEGMNLAWFDSLGLVNLVQRYGQLNR